jgi:hypothetical protein
MATLTMFEHVEMLSYGLPAPAFIGAGKPSVFSEYPGMIFNTLHSRNKAVE